MYFFLFLVFLTTVSFVRFVYLVFFQRKHLIKERLQEQNKRAVTSEVRKEGKSESIRERIFRSLTTNAYYKKQIKLLSRAYIKMKPEEVMIISILLSILFALSAWILQKPIILIILFAAFGIILPQIILKLVASRRAKKMNLQLPQALSLISNGLRAGFSFNQALGIVAQEMEVPIGEEFGRILNENNLGKPMDEVLTEFKERTEDEDMSIFITAVLTQLEVGGNLSEILEIIANTIRERAALKGEINTLTSQSKLSAIIIGILPVALATVIYFLNPEYMIVLFQDPIGLIMVTAAGLLMVIGIFMLYKIVNIKI